MQTPEIDDSVCIGEIEAVFTLAKGRPLHGVFRFHHVEFPGQCSGISRLGQIMHIHSCADQHTSAACKLTQASIWAQKLRGAKTRHEHYAEQALSCDAHSRSVEENSRVVKFIRHKALTLKAPSQFRYGSSNRVALLFE